MQLGAISNANFHGANMFRNDSLGPTDFTGSNLATVPQTLFHPLLEQFPAQDLLLESYQIFPKASSHEFGGATGLRCKGVQVLIKLST